MKKSLRKAKGFSLIELIIVIGLVSFMTLLLSSFITQSMKSYHTKRQSVDEEEKAAHVMREFELTTRAATKILVANENEYKFLRYMDLTSPEPIQVRYFAENGQFKIGYTNPSGTAPNITYPSENETIELVVTDVVNPTPIFSYFSSGNAALSFPIDIAQIRMVELEICLDENMASPPGPVTQRTMVSLRNMKDNL